MAEVVAGAVLGVAFQQLYSAIVKAIGSASRFKDLLQKLEATVNALRPNIEKVDELIQSFGDDDAKEKIQSFILQLNKAEWLVSTCSEIKRRNFRKKRKYKKILKELDESLNLILRIHLPTVERNTILKLLGEILEKNKKLDKHVVEQTKATEDNLSNPQDEIQLNSLNPEIASKGNSSGHRLGFTNRKKDKKGEKHVKYGFEWK